MRHCITFGLVLLCSVQSAAIVVDGGSRSFGIGDFYEEVEAINSAQLFVYSGAQLVDVSLASSSELFQDDGQIEGIEVSGGVAHLLGGDLDKYTFLGDGGLVLGTEGYTFHADWGSAESLGVITGDFKKSGAGSFYIELHGGDTQEVLDSISTTPEPGMFCLLGLGVVFLRHRKVR